MLAHGIGCTRRGEEKQWGAVRTALEERGARVFYGGEDAMGSVEQGAGQLACAVAESACASSVDKVNLIAHSKGGLEARYLASHGGAPMVASLTTIATPHHGSVMADRMMLPRPFYRPVGWIVDACYRLAGDERPRCYVLLGELKRRGACALDAECPDQPGVYYQSFALIQEHWRENPGNAMMAAVLAKVGGGPNDGLVSLRSAGADGPHFRGVLRRAGGASVAHSALGKHPEFFIRIVSELKQRGF
ncbi:MAG: hypothetical protein LBL67_00370 [Coriobacteriales bacterium]|nr:hypothetical protein [Coriobacteriales bacterium]